MMVMMIMALPRCVDRPFDRCGDTGPKYAYFMALHSKTRL